VFLHVENRPDLGKGGAVGFVLPKAMQVDSPPTVPSLNIRFHSSNLNATKESGEPDIAGNGAYRRWNGKFVLHGR
jgi:hypothetical protein